MGTALASDPAGDMSEPNLDLQGLYVVEDTDNFYIGSMPPPRIGA